jgi:hypothetical protein
VAIDRGIEGKDHLTHPFRANPRHQIGDAQLIRPYGIERRKGAAQHMIAALEGAAAFHRPKVGHIFDDAQLSGGARGIGTDGADLRGADVAANRAITG